MKPTIILCVALIATFLSLCGCKTHKCISETADAVTRIEYREKTVFVPDTVIITIPAQTSERITTDSVSHLETEYAESDAMVTADGFLHHTLRNKPQEKPLPIQARIEYRDSIVYVEKVKTIKEPRYIEKDLTTWQQFRLKTYAALLAALLASLVWIFRKPLLNLIRRLL